MTPETRQLLRSIAWHTSWAIDELVEEEPYTTEAGRAAAHITYLLAGAVLRSTGGINRLRTDPEPDVSYH